MSTFTQMQKTAVNAQSPAGSSQAGLLVQRRCGCGGTPALAGECESCRKKRLHGSLTIGASNDPLEREAERVADQVMAGTVRSAVHGAAPGIQRSADCCGACADTAPASVERVLASHGEPLEPAVRQEMEQRFAHDFSRVRVHRGAAAEQSAREVNAQAYTVGEDIVFGANRFNPAAESGLHLLAHELTHVVQQSNPPTLDGNGHHSLSQRITKGALRRIRRLGGNPGCTNAQAADIHQAIYNANSWVGKALTALAARPLAARTLRALRNNFGASGTAANAGTVATNLRAGRADMLRNPYSCRDATDATCSTAPCGYTTAAGVHASVICTNATLATNDAVYRAGCVLHEAMHASDASMTVDSYSGWFGHSASTPGYPGAAPLTNADSYTTLAMELS